MATKKTVKKTNPKEVAKNSVMESIREHYESQGFEVLNGSEFGFTSSTLVLRLDECDVQVKLVTPSAKNGNQYSPIEEE